MVVLFFYDLPSGALFRGASDGLVLARTAVKQKGLARASTTARLTLRQDGQLSTIEFTKAPNGMVNPEVASVELWPKRPATLAARMDRLEHDDLGDR